MMFFHCIYLSLPLILLIRGVTKGQYSLTDSEVITNILLLGDILMHLTTKQ